MMFYSTKNKSFRTGIKTAILNGLAPDGGLYMPDQIPKLPRGFFDSILKLSLREIAFKTLNPYLNTAISDAKLKTIIKETFTFDIPLVKLSDNVFVLELFHGQTLAFKDIGAKFMANLMACINSEKATILVATSGDTGSAVASGFLNAQNINVVILYPKGQVSKIQEQQLTAIGKNVTALEVEGSFDDCQNLVKQAFVDNGLKTRINLSSANSINIARLIPQMVYYFYACAQLKNILSRSRETGFNTARLKPAVISVPSGNFGNLTAGLFAKRMGLEVHKFIAAINANDVLQKYLETGEFKPRQSIRTISNSMDVGNPSNFARMLELYDNNHKKMGEDILGFSFTDDETVSGMKEVYEKYQYILDPHSAVGYLGLKKYMGKNGCTGIILGTAHPAKFKDIVENAISAKIEMPKTLKKYLGKEKKSIQISNRFDDLKEFLLNH